MRTLVTGGAGFIGSHLVEELVAQGDDVVVIDDFSTGSMANLASVRDEIMIYERDLSIMSKVELLDVTQHVDRVFHLASVVGVRLYVDNPVATIQTIIRSTESVIESLAGRRDIPLIITSTSEVYGRGVSIPMREDDDLLYGPTSKSRWSYGMAKAIDEHLALGYVQRDGLDIRTVRLFNAVGPRQLGAYGMVMAIFVNQAVRGLPVTVHETGMQTRTFCHVSDIVQGLISVSETQAASGTVMNLGSDEEISMLDLAKRVIEVTGSESEIVHIPYSDVYGDGFEDMMRRCPDVSKAERVIGFERRVDLDNTIRDIARWVASESAAKA